MVSEELHSIIFVDDESIVRDGISTCISWDEMGFRLAGLFENGEQALEYVRKHPVDVVITDINMPKMDGLTLSRILSEELPRIMVLLLTGYDEFEYAQEAVKHHVREFLLKPITADELREVLARIRTDLMTMREQAVQQEMMREKLKESIPLLKERFLYRLVTGRLKRENYSRGMGFYTWKDMGRFYQVAVISPPRGWDDLDVVALSEFLKSETDDAAEVFSNAEENLVILLQGDDSEALSGVMKEVTEKTFAFTFGLEKEKIFGGYGGIVSSPELIQQSYREACTALDYSQVLGITRILSIHNVRERQEISSDYFNFLLQNLTDKLKEGGQDQTRAALDEVFLYLEKHVTTSEDASRYLAILHFHIAYYVNDLQLFEETPPLIPENSEIFKSLDGAKVFFHTLLREVEEQIGRRRQDMLLSRIDRAREIISRRFMEVDFSLKDICNELYLSTSQFSLIFKEGTGRTFVEYLTWYRMEEAKKLLKTSDKKVYEVAEAVGYTDPRYFSLLFKKTTGMTAVEYRNSLEQT